MAEDLAALETWIGELMQRMSEGERRGLARTIATDLRRAQVENIAAQRGPDGAAFAPRRADTSRPAFRSKAGRIKRQAKQRPMFVKLRSPRHLGVRSTADEARVAFHGAAARIARVHHLGLRDKVSRREGAPEASYPERPLLGFNDAMRARIMDRILAHIGDQ